MAAYNPPQQVLFNPVLDFYQGKAIRQQLESGEVDIELKKAELEGIPAAKAAAQREEQRKTDAAKRAQEKADREVEKAGREGREAEVGYLAEASAAAVVAFKEGGSLEQSTSAFMEKMSGYGATDEDLAEMTKAYDPDGDGIFNEDMMVELEALAFSKHKWDQENADTKTHINYQMPDGSVVAARPDSPEADEIVAAGGTVAGAQSLAGGEDGGIKTADQSFILRMTTQHFGGLFDEATNAVKFLDPAKQREASQVTALAANLLQEGKAENAADAVKRAMIAYGQKWEEPGEAKAESSADAAERAGITVKELERSMKVHGLTASEVADKMVE